MKSFVFILSCVLPFFIFGQFSKERVLFIDMGKKHDLKIADLNGDRNDDIIVASEIGVAWYNNLGGEHFSRRKIISLNPAQSIQVFDFDEDGDQDIIATGLIFSPQNMVWYENKGNGTFEEAVLIKSNVARGILYLDDLDGDELEDLVLSYSRGVEWFKNENGRNLSAPKSIINGSSVNSISRLNAVSLNDVNNDGNVDIINLRGVNSLEWQENDGNGNFTERRITNSLNDPTVVFSGDIDNDNRLDILTVDEEGVEQRLLRYEVTNQGTLSESVIYTWFPTDIDMDIIHIDDLDNDGDLDLVLGKNEDNSSVGIDAELLWLEQISSNTFREHIITQFREGLSTSLGPLTAISTKDFREDSYPEIVFTFNDFCYVINNTVQGLSEDFRNLSSGNIRSRIAADLNQDDMEDIIAAFGLDQEIRWYENKGENQFPTYQVIANGYSAYNLNVADLDEDGNLDIAFNDFTGTHFLYLDESLSIIDTNYIPQNDDFYVARLELTDIDLDGKLDLVRTDYFGEIEVYRNQGDRTISLSQRFRARSNIERLVVGKIDEDELEDIVYFGNGENMNDGTGFYWLKNENGIFAAPVLVAPLLSNSLPTRLVDLDRDGILDLVYASLDGLHWIKNNGDGSFEAASLILSGDDFVRGQFHFFDVENDGDNDLILTGSDFFTKELTLFFNDGIGDFTDTGLSSSILLKGVVDADFNDDGFNDLLALSQDGDLLWLENVLNRASVLGSIFLDENKNATKEANEPLIRNFSIKTEPGALSTYTNEDGKYKLSLEEGTYIISPEIPENWSITTNPESYSIDIGEATNLSTSFGVVPDFEATLMESYLTSAPTRCGFKVDFWIDYINNGSQREQGPIQLVLDERVEVINTSESPYFISGDTLYWYYFNLAPTQSGQIALRLQMPGVEAIGDTLKMQVITSIRNQSGAFQAVNTYDFASEIRCAYDPNDKLVLPNRSDQYDQNFTLFDEELEYTIRFQNTGTDTAFTVVIRDSLDVNLDWNTFKPISASHNFETTLDGKNGIVEFKFSDILLPDSTTNEVASHGYVKYHIRAKENLAENTKIQNTANIFFDFNPPIRTNTIENILVSELPKSTSVNARISDASLKVYPNPFDEQFILEIKQLKLKYYQLRLFDLNGRLIDTYLPVSDSKFMVETVELPQGIYFYQLVEKDSGNYAVGGKLVKLKY